MTAASLHFINNVPHTVHHGTHDDSATGCQFQFWRCGRGFSVSVRSADVQETDFQWRWRHLVDDDGTHTLDKFERWYSLCGLILDSCQRVLSELAPPGNDWTTLQDLLHSPHYTLELRKAEPGPDVAAYLVEGPKEKPAFSLHPISVSEPKIPTRRAQDLFPDFWHGHQIDCVKDIEGKWYTLLRCEYGPQDLSWTTIQAYARMHQASAHVPRFICLVNDGDMIAGALLEYVNYKSSLRSLVTEATSNHRLEKVEQKLMLWQDSLRSTVATLHGQGIGLSTSEYGSTINEGNIQVDQKGQIWLPFAFGTTSIGAEVGPGQKRSDMDNIDAVFKERLPSLISKARARLMLD